MLAKIDITRTACRRPQVARSPCLRVLAHGHGHGHGASPHGHGTKTMEKGEKEKGFVNDMRMVAMKLHTREQAPKEGQAEAAPKPKTFAPTREGYLRFLIESKAVYDVLETVVQDNSHPEYAAFCNTGLERAKALEEDIAWFHKTLNMDIPSPLADGPGLAYGQKIRELAAKDPQAFICHYYNFYFAHTAGGRMIGSKVSQMVLDNHQLKFYQWDGDVAVFLDDVRRKINQLAETWTEEQKQHCLAETKASFQYSGKILECITQ